jgi:hypothetical protein
MPDITVHRHGDRWAVLERGAESPVKELPSREAAELVARQMAGGGAVEVIEEDPTGLEEVQDAGAGDSVSTGEAETVDTPESSRSRQAGL